MSGIFDEMINESSSLKLLQIYTMQLTNQVLKCLIFVDEEIFNQSGISIQIANIKTINKQKIAKTQRNSIFLLLKKVFWIEYCKNMSTFVRILFKFFFL
jgi:hypothetical protein